MILLGLQKLCHFWLSQALENLQVSVKVLKIKLGFLWGLRNAQFISAKVAWKSVGYTLQHHNNKKDKKQGKSLFRSLLIHPYNSKHIDLSPCPESISLKTQWNISQQPLNLDENAKGPRNRFPRSRYIHIKWRLWNSFLAIRFWSNLKIMCFKLFPFCVLQVLIK